MLEKVGKLRRSAFLLAWSYLGDYLNWRACSTPYGITEVGTGRIVREAASDGRVLNALRHHRGRHGDRHRHRLGFDSAQRLTASQRSAHGTATTGRSAARCSTPYGITEVGTRSGSRSPRVAECAQRLTASQRSARARAIFVTNGRWQCSTPYGITEVGTDQLRVRGGSDHVRCSTPYGITEVGTGRFGGIASPGRLCSTPYGITEVGTASRLVKDEHDECSTPYGITEVGTARPRSSRMSMTSAQRLTASQRSALGTVRLDRRRSVECSTPYGITEVGTSPAPRVGSPGTRCSTPYGITEVGTRSEFASAHPASRVLNALRHHRGRHTGRTEYGPADSSCSTPYGITEVGTTGRGARTAADRDVLNALRHHRGRHRQVAVGRQLQRVLNALRHHRGRHTEGRGCTDRRPQECSTPYGITEVGTRAAWPQASCRREVLNALRHHRGRHSDANVPRTRAADVLNAFRHHRGRHGSLSAVERQATRGCSTPYGITEVGTLQALLAHGR